YFASRSGRLLPACAVCGAGFVLLCDLVSRLIFMPYELPVGILMSVVGGPVFLWMLVCKKRENEQSPF
ncbi:MAG: iron chelate uptake ABC transporter family permease subunit, partial [Lachnospiraceae bacterium]|nr:iron chelate uptake ABC transporter family permease subunit [Lachnospiraceae bacterium]